MKKPLPVAMAVIVLSVMFAAQAPVDQSKLAQQLLKRRTAVRKLADIVQKQTSRSDPLY